MFVMRVIRHSVKRALLEHINAYTVVSALMFVMCVKRHTVIKEV